MENFNQTSAKISQEANKIKNAAKQAVNLGVSVATGKMPIGEGAKEGLSILKIVVGALLAIFVALIVAALMFISLVVVVAAIIITLLTSIFGFNEDKLNDLADDENYETTISDACKASREEINPKFRDRYQVLAEEANGNIQTIVLSKTGLDVGNESKVSKDATLTNKTWNYEGYEETSKITVSLYPTNPDDLSNGIVAYIQGYYATLAEIDDVAMALAKSELKSKTTVYKLISEDVESANYFTKEDCRNVSEHAEVVKGNADDPKVKNGETTLDNSNYYCKYSFIDDIETEEGSNTREAFAIMTVDSIADHATEVLQIQPDGSDWNIDVEEGSWEVVVEDKVCHYTPKDASQYGAMQQSGWNYAGCTEGDEGKVLSYKTETKTGPVGTITIPVTLNQEILSSITKNIEDIGIKMLLEYKIAESTSEAQSTFNGLLQTEMENISSSCGDEGSDIFSVLAGYDGVHGVVGYGEYSGSVDWQSYAYGETNGDLYNATKLNAHWSEVWSEVRSVLKAGNLGGSGFASSGINPQCTDLVHAMFYTYYGKDSGGGNGDQMARNTVTKYPDEFYNGLEYNSETGQYELNLKAGSIISTVAHNHVGFVNAVLDTDGDGVVDHYIVSDGNITRNDHKAVNAPRVWAIYNLTDFYKEWGSYGLTAAVPK